MPTTNYIFENDNYGVLIADSPGKHTFECYGVYNKKTHVIEAYIGQLARAIQTAKQYNTDLVEGYPDPVGAFSDYIKASMAMTEYEEAVAFTAPAKRKRNN